MSPYADYVAGLLVYRLDHQEQRAGQAAVNYLYDTRAGIDVPDEADPFYDDTRLPAFMAFVHSQLTEPAIGSRVVEVGTPHVWTRHTDGSWWCVCDGRGVRWNWSEVLADIGPAEYRIEVAA